MTLNFLVSSTHSDGSHCIVFAGDRDAQVAYKQMHRRGEEAAEREIGHREEGGAAAVYAE